MYRIAKFTLVLSLVPGALALWGETLPKDTQIVVRLDKDVQRDENKKQTFTASLAYPIFVHGREAVPAGTRIEGDVRGSKKTIFLSPRRLVLINGDKIDFNASVAAVSNKKLKAQEKEGTIEKKGSDAGAATQQAGEMGTEGAIIGAMSTGTWAGVGIGAAAGVGAVLIGRQIAGRHGSTVIPAGTQMTLNLNVPVEVPDEVEDARAPEPKFSDRDDRRPILRREDPQPGPDSNPERSPDAQKPDTRQLVSAKPFLE